MIVGCPECSTDFKLPVDKLPDKGAKVRCSKCSHTFRVRIGEEGEPEIFYKSEGVADPPTQELGDLFDEEDGNKTQLGRPATEGDDDAEPEGETVDPSKTQIGKPTSKSASKDYNPFPFAGKLEKGEDEGNETQPGVAATAHRGEEEDVNLFDEGDETVVTDPDEDPFEGAFEEEEEEEEVEALQAGIPGAASMEDFAGDEASVGGDEAKSALPMDEPAAASVDESSGPVAEAETAAEPAVQTTDDVFAGEGRSDFGSADELVDPSFGSDGPVFDPSTGRVETSQQMQTQPAQAQAEQTNEKADQPAPAQSQQQAQAQPQPAEGQAAAARKVAPTPRKAAEAAAAKAGASAPARKKAEPKPETSEPAPKTSPTPEPAVSEPVSWDVEPHTIGGSGWRKFANFLLIIFVVGNGFLAAVAVLNDGHIDFKNFPHMLEVAFEGKTYEPREEWAPPPPPPPPVNKEPLKVQNAFVQLIAIDDGEDHILLVRGDVKNDGDKSFEDIRVRTKLLDPSGRVLREQASVIATSVDYEKLSDLEKPEDAAGLVSEAPETVSSGGTKPFAVIFDDVPKMVLDNRDVDFHVEVVSKTEVE